MEQKKVNYKGKGLAYRVSGEGPTVVLLHGFGEDSSIWKNQYGIFPNHKLIIPDLPGSGGSEVIDDMSIEGLADAVKFVADAAQNSLSSGEGRGEVALIGHSMGGYVTLAFAEKYPDSLTAFGLFHSTAYADSEAKKEARRKGIEFMNNKDGGAFLETTMPNLYSDKTKEEKWSLVEAQLGTVHNFSAPALVSYYEAMMNRTDRTPILCNSTVPVLFVMGRHDTAVPVEDVLKQCHLPQIAYIHILENSGHMGMMEETEETNKIFAGFVAGL